ncbi:hypothetical protein ACSBR2_024653 [Camellia fascicularis]
MGSFSKTKRSISLPCQSHPSTARIEEELNKMKIWDESSKPTTKAVSNGMSRLEDLYMWHDPLNLLNLIHYHSTAGLVVHILEARDLPTRFFASGSTRRYDYEIFSSAAFYTLIYTTTTKMGSFSKTKRSISLPCQSHPSIARIEEELNKMKIWDESSKPTAKAVSNGMSRLEDLYKCMEDLLNLPRTQQALSHHQHEKWIGDLQAGFVNLLDICGTERDVMTEIKEHVRDLQSALRRRKGDSSIETNIAKYTRFRKKAKKDAKKLIAAMKKIDNKIEATPLLELDQHISSVIKALREIVAASTFILHSLLLFLSVPILKSKSTRRSLENVNELESVDVAWHSLCKSDSSEGDKLQIAQNSFKSLEASIEEVENVLECLFRRFIKARVTLLNIVSH